MRLSVHPTTKYIKKSINQEVNCQLAPQPNNKEHKLFWLLLEPGYAEICVGMDGWMDTGGGRVVVHLLTW